MSEIILLSAGSVITFMSVFMMLRRRPSEVQKYFLTASIGIFMYMQTALIKRFITDHSVFVRIHELTYFFKLVAVSGLLLGLFEICGVKLSKKQRFFINSTIVVLSIVFLTAHFHGSFCRVETIYPHPDGTPGIYLNKCHEGWLYYASFALQIAVLLYIGIYLLLKLLKKSGEKARYIKILILALIFPVLPWLLRQLAGIPNAITDHLTYIADTVIMAVLIMRYDIDMTAPVIKEQAIETSSDGIVITDRHRRFRYANKAAESLFPALSDENDDKVTAFIANHLSDSVIDKNGRKYEIRTNAERDENENIHGYLTLIRDISEQEERIRAEEALKTAAEREKIATELELAANIQRAAIPHNFPAFPDRTEFDIFASMVPAKYVGGDFYDFFLVDDDHLCLMIADVSGKGIPASLFMMVANAILKNCAMLGKTPAEILFEANKSICSNNETEMFVTVWIGILEISTGKLTAANAGHEYPIFMNEAGEFGIFKDKHGLSVGLMDGSRYREYEVTLRPGEKIFVFTDGATEATALNEEMFGTERLIETLNAGRSKTPEELLHSVSAAVAEFVGEAEQFDDLTMLCMEYKGSASKSESAEISTELS